MRAWLLVLALTVPLLAASLGTVTCGALRFELSYAAAAYVIGTDEGRHGCTLNLLLYDRPLDPDIEQRIRNWEGLDLSLEPPRATAALALEVAGKFLYNESWVGEYAAVGADLTLPAQSLRFTGPEQVRVQVRIREPWMVSLRGTLQRPEASVALSCKVQAVTVRYKK